MLVLPSVKTEFMFTLFVVSLWYSADRLSSDTLVVLRRMVASLRGESMDKVQVVALIFLVASLGCNATREDVSASANLGEGK